MIKSSGLEGFWATNTDERFAEVIWKMFPEDVRIITFIQIIWVI